MNSILIGIDGGATKINAYLVEMSENNTFHLQDISIEQTYADIPGFISDFSPLPLQKQLDDYKNNDFNLSADEIQQGSVYVEACAQVIEFLAQKSKCRDIIVGIGMPGLKTADKKGIAVLANGPRMPRYTAELEERLAMGKVNFVQPVKRLGSDADYCGIGENYAENGLFRDVNNAYYIGLGTGAADALKIDGKLLPFDRTKEWLAKTWEMKNSDGISLESIVSARGMQNIYAGFTNKSPQVLTENNIFTDEIIQRAHKGEQEAQKTCRVFYETLSALLFERIITLNAGWQDNFLFVNPNRPPLNKRHPYIGYTFERIIIGQRIGTLMKTETGKKQLAEPLIASLKRKIEETSLLNSSSKAHYASLDKIIVFSDLRAAPALGAAVDAMIYGDDNA
jgi:predicted NBD/HSP70 family sugar kinase